MANIADYLKKILSAVYGRDVRQAIHDAIRQCYEDGKAGSIDLTAREEVAAVRAGWDSLEQFVFGKRLVNRAHVTYFAQGLPAEDNTGFASQGFCIARADNTSYAVNCYINGVSGYMSIYNMETGELVRRGNVGDLGHANSCTYNPRTGHIYVAMAGGSSRADTVAEVDMDLNLVACHDLGEGSRPYGIAYSNDGFYVLMGGGRIGRYTSGFALVRTVNFASNSPQTVYQGLAADDRYLYVPNGNTRDRSGITSIPVQLIDVYRHDGAFVKHIPVDIPLELEELDLYDGGVILSCNSRSRAIMFHSHIHEEPGIDGSMANGHQYNMIQSGYYQQIYVDGTYTGFLMDGSREHPVCSSYIIEPAVFNGIETLQIQLLSNIDENINIRESTTKIDVRGNGFACRGCYFANNKRVSLRNITISGRSDPEDSAVAVHNCHYLFTDNVTIDPAGCSYGVHLVASTAIFNTVSFVSSAKVSNLVVTENAGLTANSMADVSTLGYVIRASQASVAAAAFNLNFITGNHNISSDGLKRQTFVNNDILKDLDLNTITAECHLTMSGPPYIEHQPDIPDGYVIRGIDSWRIFGAIGMRQHVYATNGTDIRIYMRTYYFNGTEATMEGMWKEIY